MNDLSHHDVLYSVGSHVQLATMCTTMNTMTLQIMMTISTGSGPSPPTLAPAAQHQCNAEEQSCDGDPVGRVSLFSIIDDRHSVYHDHLVGHGGDLGNHDQNKTFS